MMWLPLVLALADSEWQIADGRMELGVGLTARDCYVLEAVGAAWYYNWDVVGEGCQSESVPMHYQGWRWPSQEYPPAYLLMFNEPDYAPQGAISPEQGAAEWRQAEMDFPGTMLVGPGISPHGAAWLGAWYEAYLQMYGRPPRLDVAAVHCYFPTWQECRDWIETQWAWFQGHGARALWVTELSFLPCWYPEGDQETRRQGDALLAWMREQPYIRRVAWFATHVTSRGVWWPDGCQTPLADTRDLTALGRWWRDKSEGVE